MEISLYAIWQIVFFLVGGATAGFIDSIAGGGGLITLPLLGIILGPSVEAIATNKIVGTSGALMALIIYARKGHLAWRHGLVFVACISLGAFTGTLLLPFIPKEWIRWIIISVCPLLLYVVWKKDHWVGLAEKQHHQLQTLNFFSFSMVISGFLCGIYDGAFGPGGGTFMLLALALVVKLPLLAALAISKLANTFSAGTSLISYGVRGYVHWSLGCLVAIGMMGGAFFGAQLAAKKSVTVIRPMLTVAVLLLLGRLLLS